MADSRRLLVAGNWKMHGSSADNAALIAGVLSKLDASNVDVLVCPPFVYLADVAARLKGTPVQLGAQSLCAEAMGAYTGEISGAMLKDVGCQYVLVGHSERRSLYGEDNALVARKYVAALANGLIPVLCVGETLAERDANNTFSVISAQLDAVLTMAGVQSLDRAVIAYEPVWAIGTGRTATPEQAQEVHAFIRTRVAAHDSDVAGRVRILYGGSVKGSNAAQLFGMADVDGGLVGGASLKAEEFLQICAAAN